MDSPGGAVIFDVDGVLLELTDAEADLFFVPFEVRYGLTGLSRDWNSYRIRNDRDIAAEILETHGLPVDDCDIVITHYIDVMRASLRDGAVTPVEIPGARALLENLSGQAAIGIATANFSDIAQLRLTQAGLWEYVAQYPFGAEAGGHKRDTLARAIAATGIPRRRIIYVGDNLNDVDAGLSNGVHFIGFCADAERREALGKAGARHLSGDHATTARLIAGILLEVG
jgi:phosphoglycolate phosphatase-like HAD superfamily hydrolase